LLFSKSASDLLSPSGGGGGGNSSAKGDGSTPPAWERLSKPKVFQSTVISPLFDDIAHCRFAPQINEVSQQLAAGDFQNRLAASVDMYVTRRLRADNEQWMPKDATFQPQLNRPRPGSAAASMSASSSSIGLSSREAFVARMQEDLSKRKEHAELVAKTMQHPFTPTISASSRKRCAKITTPFLDRLADDLATRDDAAHTRRSEATKLPPGSFQPNAARMQTTQYSFNAFLGRMDNDWEERRTKYEERCRKFGLPTPEEVAASVRNGRGGTGGK